MNGICIRLYDEADFLSRAEYTDAKSSVSPWQP